MDPDWDSVNMGPKNWVNITKMYANSPECPSGWSTEYPCHTLTYTIPPPPDSNPSKKETPVAGSANDSRTTPTPFHETARVLSNSVGE